MLSCFFAPPSFAAAFGFDALFGDVTSASERFSDGVRTLACVVRIMLGLRGGEKASSTAGTVYCPAGDKERSDTSERPSQ